MLGFLNCFFLLLITLCIPVFPDGSCNGRFPHFRITLRTIFVLPASLWEIKKEPAFLTNAFPEYGFSAKRAAALTRLNISVTAFGAQHILCPPVAPPDCRLLQVQHIFSDGFADIFDCIVGGCQIAVQAGRCGGAWMLGVQYFRVFVVGERVFDVLPYKLLIARPCHIDLLCFDPAKNGIQFLKMCLEHFFKFCWGVAKSAGCNILEYLAGKLELPAGILGHAQYAAVTIFAEGVVNGLL